MNIWGIENTNKRMDKWISPVLKLNTHGVIFCPMDNQVWSLRLYIENAWQQELGYYLANYIDDSLNFSVPPH